MNLAINILTAIGLIVVGFVIALIVGSIAGWIADHLLAPDDPDSQAAYDREMRKEGR